MFTSKHRVRLSLEQLEARATPSALRDGPPAPFLHHHGGHEAKAASQVRVSDEHAIPIKVAFRCSGDLSSMTTHATGFGTHLGHWTGQGRLESFQLDPAADRGTISGTFTVVTANGDELFTSFSTSFQLSTGKGQDVITVTGGTGRFAGASGQILVNCTITLDPSSPTTYACNCEGGGMLILSHR